mmetsp:Transcript_23105/g.40646  ORF Transcript_23105/g.40646 Transcript_23105/m.40646 type:complete len:122 (-) Transcript_23105:1196-1561(-)
MFVPSCKLTFSGSCRLSGKLERTVGESLGLLVSFFDAVDVGSTLIDNEGNRVGESLAVRVGCNEGCNEGDVDNITVGSCEGSFDGTVEGDIVGSVLGCSVGMAEGVKEDVGDIVGAISCRP